MSQQQKLTEADDEALRGLPKAFKAKYVIREIQFEGNSRIEARFAGVSVV